MDLQHIKDIYHTLYSDINGYTVSSHDRAQLRDPDKSYTYGEVAPESFYKILKIAKPEKGDVFYDLGSGTGKAVILASLMFDFSRCVGIELLEGLWQTSKSVVHRFHMDIEPHLIHNHRTKIELIQDDFLEYDFSDGNIIFAHSTCFSEQLWVKLIKKFEELPSGTRVIGVTKSITSPHLELIRSQEFLMGWGQATVSVYKKI